jgi:hypothetical protein
VASDKRWTGGVANRGWQSGTALEPVVDADAIAVQVRRYLADCRKYKAVLSPAHHPTEKSMLQVVFTRSDTEKRAAIAAFREAVSRG